MGARQCLIIHRYASDSTLTSALYQCDSYSSNKSLCHRTRNVAVRTRTRNDTIDTEKQDDLAVKDSRDQGATPAPE